MIKDMTYGNTDYFTVGSGKEYKPNLVSHNGADRLSDFFLGTNKKQLSTLNNEYELKKAENINKYSWNVQGMKQAGINPVLASNNAANVSGGIQDADTGSNVVEMLIQMLPSIIKSAGGK